jgi:hypothetical protein
MSLHVFEWRIFNRSCQVTEAEGTAPDLETAKSRVEEAAKKDYGTQRLSLIVEHRSTGECWQKHPIDGWEKLT